MTFAALLAMFTLIVLLVSWRDLTARWAAVKGLLLAGAVAAIIWAPVLIPIAREFVTGDYGVSGWGESVKLSADVVGLVTPTDLNPLASDRRAGSDTWPAALRAVEEGKGRFGDINTVFLGFVTLALAVIGAIAARRRLAAWIWTALIFGILALGPLLQIAGRYRFSLDNLLPEGVTLAAAVHAAPFPAVHQRQPRAQPQQHDPDAGAGGVGGVRGGVVAGENRRMANQQISKSANGRRWAQYAIRSTQCASPRLPVYLSTRRPRHPRTPRRTVADHRRVYPGGLPAHRGGAGCVRGDAVAARLAR